VTGATSLGLSLAGLVARSATSRASGSVSPTFKFGGELLTAQGIESRGDFHSAEMLLAVLATAASGSPASRGS